jgi:hypothetical protein
MKILKELLLERHRSAQPKLDAAREEFLARLGRSRSSVRPDPRGFPCVWREYLLPLRWHLAGISAAWLMILLLSAESAPAPAHAVAQAPALTSQQLLTALRHNRQEILDLTQPPPVPSPPLPPRRSQVLPSTAMA